MYSRLIGNEDISRFNLLTVEQIFRGQAENIQNCLRALLEMNLAYRQPWINTAVPG